METITWISVAEARKHPACQSTKAGKGRIDLATLYRWVQRGRIRGWYRRPFLFVCREDLDALMEPVQSEAPRRVVVSKRAAAEAWADETLRRMGVR